MKPGNIATDQAAFRDWVREVLRPRALSRLLRETTFDRAMAEVRLLPEVLARQAKQKEFSIPIWEYLEIAASDERARKGRQMLRQHRDLFNRVEQAFGVEPEVIAAIWGLETGYGVIRGDTPVLSALATLAYGGRRASYFEDELIVALRLIQTHAFKPETLVGSWAGAIGHGQFMPSAILDFGVDFDGDGRADITAADPTDGIASIANYLKKHEWKKGQPWGFEVRLPEGFDFGLSGLDQVLPSRDWAAMGLRAADGGPVPDYGPGSLLLPAGARGVALLVLRNFLTILRYNKAEAYAIGIGALADRIGGARGFVGGWPVDEKMLGRDDLAELQFLLTRAGFDTKGVDGLSGPNTTRALRGWQAARGLLADGYVTASVLARLREERAKAGDLKPDEIGQHQRGL